MLIKNPQAVNDPNDLEKVFPEEVKEHPGFFYYPDDKRLAVSRNGIVLNLLTLKRIRGSFGNDKVHIHIVDGAVKRCVYKLHRIIARTFIGRPSRHLNKSFDRLEVNHINGAKSNNSLENLEWVTGRENVIHSHKTGLHPRDKKVLAFNLKTKGISNWNSVKECADFYGIHRASLWKHLYSGNSGKYHKDGFVFKFDDGSDWVIPPIDQIRKLGSGARISDFIVTDTSDGNKTILTLEQTCLRINMNVKYFYKFSNGKNKFCYFNFIIERL